METEDSYPGIMISLIASDSASTPGKYARRPDETEDAWTDRLHREGAAKGIFRQCSIGWHFECSDWSGQHGCQCLCHELAEKVILKAKQDGLIP